MYQKDILEELIRTALAEDIGQGVFTTLAIVDKDKNGQAKIIAKQNGVDLISIGALTHSAPVFDFSLLLEGV